MGRLNSKYLANRLYETNGVELDASGNAPGYDSATQKLSDPYTTDDGRTLHLIQNKTKDEIFADTLKAEEARYQELYRPLNQQIMSRIGDNSIVDAANKSLDDAIGVKQQQRRARQMDRYGVTETAAQAVQNNKLTSLDDALTRTNIMADARVKQHDRDNMLRSELINLGRGISRSGMDGLNTAANAEAQRNMIQSQADAQKSAQKMQMTGMGVGAAIAMSNPVFAALGIGMGLLD